MTDTSTLPEDENQDETYINEFLDAIHGDASKALNELLADGSQYNRRMFIRAFYSFIEGSLYHFRREMLEDSDRKFSTAERSVLAEESYYVGKQDQIKTKKNNYLTFEQSFRLTLRYYFPRSYSKVVSYKDGGWDALDMGLKVRNRITHPKTFEQLHITDEESETFQLAYFWYGGLMIDLHKAEFDEVKKEMNTEIEAFRKEEELLLRKKAALDKYLKKLQSEKGFDLTSDDRGKR